MTDMAVGVLDVMADSGLKFAVLAAVTELATRRACDSRPDATHRLWILVSAVSLLLPAIAVLTSPTIRVQPGQAMVSSIAAVTSAYDVVGLVATVLVAGALVGVIRLVAGLVAVSRLVRRSNPLADADADRLLRLADVRARRANRCGVRESGVIAVPVTAGYFRPCILLPVEWRQWPQATLHSVLVHEGAHVDRGDYLKGVLIAAMRALWWWHPGAWVAGWRAQLTAEMVCDVRAVSRTSPDIYAEQLLELAKRVSRRRPRFAWTVGATSVLSARIDAILTRDTAACSRLHAALGFAIVVIAAAVVCASASVRFTPVVNSQEPQVVPEVHTGSDHSALHAARHARH